MDKKNQRLSGYLKRYKDTSEQLNNKHSRLATTTIFAIASY